ncbi:hypothetical protein AtubIFM56815_007913 [Aspergillus tubingensis]|uniref:Uncharacterized protein n=2 Tax=Aspergillus subgen. Circumdati TaxID=2720871 RepID=A0A100IE65_ASPNG|nr:glycine-rich domain-containing protein 2 [Aspergillus tubingensis]GAQ39642.1 hypothetical protein AKAW_04276 [Aspergillus niger]GFN18048.1 glycine-rich domain-containing protein 2 [Aspergillus tubingensis]GLA83708.1 hypothetical protein AtubIFM56815_007913 [Aspergillus tubingensis]
MLLRRPFKGTTQNTSIPHQDLFKTLGTASNDTQRGISDLPAIGECAVHLELLEVFRNLRIQIIQSKELDRVFRLDSSRSWISKHRRETQRTEKWHRFVSLAVERFQIWNRAAEKQLERDGNNETLILPPVDILMVWHAFLLNPSDYKEFCTSRQLDRIQRVSFPWVVIHDCINPTNWSYTLPSPNTQWLGSTASITTNPLVTLTDTISGTQSTPDQQNQERRPSISPENEALLHNVLRQMNFIDQMHDCLWISYPDAEDILETARKRYNNFVELFRLHPGVMLVPTLDIDLVWHTHLCSAARYRGFMMERVGRFINHDDKLGKGALDDGFERTKELYEELESRGGA